MIDELKLVHCCLSVPLRRSVARANSEVQRLNVAVSGASPPAPIHVSRALEGAHRQPRRIDSRVRHIARRFIEGTQAFVGANEEKKSLKLAYAQKNILEFPRACV